MINSLSAFALVTGVVCHLIIYLCKNYWVILVGFVLYGVGIGMSYYPILKTTWKYFPEKKGFLTGLILCVFGYCPFVFTSIADAVINPDGLPADKDSGLFLDETIAIRMKNFSLIMFITMGVCGVLSQFLMFPLDNIVSTDGGQTVVEKEDNTNDNKHSYVSNEIETNNNPIQDRCRLPNPGWLHRCSAEDSVTASKDYFGKVMDFCFCTKDLITAGFNGLAMKQKHCFLQHSKGAGCYKKHNFFHVHR